MRSDQFTEDFDVLKARSEFCFNDRALLPPQSPTQTPTYPNPQPTYPPNHTPKCQYGRCRFGTLGANII